ncbi:MAG TPA: glycosyltransferase [Bryobacteraceae bacterium]|nr:glycosyltransferase [Bryobacteraceae bacterium]
MKIAVISYGTEGDTRPLVALCRGLIEAGHAPVLLGERSGAGLAAGAGVPYKPLAGDIRTALAELLARQGKASASPTEMADAMASMANAHTADWMQALLEEGRTSDAIVFSGLTAYVGLSVAEHLRIPAIGAGMQPIVPTREFPSPFLPPMRLPAWCNRFSHRLVMTLLWRSFRQSINAARKAVAGQTQRRRAWRDYPILFGVSPLLVPPPPDWPDLVRITGHWPLAGPEWEPPEAMARFLSAGEPPVYVGFGSMVGFDRHQVLQTVVKALDGRRALVSTGWSEFDSAQLPGNTLLIGPAPHDRVFRLVSLAVHHGGAGTSHTAVRAGVPSVVVPFAGDQFFWAERLTRAGAAPRSIPHSKLDARTLRSRIEEACAPAMRERAAEMGRSMSAEAGIPAAVKGIEQFVKLGLHVT